MGFPQVLTTKEQKEVYSPETTNYSKINDFVVNLYLVFFVAIFLWFNGQYVCVVRALVQTRKKSDKKLRDSGELISSVYPRGDSPTESL